MDLPIDFAYFSYAVPALTIIPKLSRISFDCLPTPIAMLSNMKPTSFPNARADALDISIIFANLVGSIPKIIACEAFPIISAVDMVSPDILRKSFIIFSELMPREDARFSKAIFCCSTLAPSSISSHALRRAMIATVTAAVIASQFFFHEFANLCKLPRTPSRRFEASSFNFKIIDNCLFVIA